MYLYKLCGIAGERIDVGVLNVLSRFMAKSPKCVKVLCCALSRHDPCRLIKGDMAWCIGLVVDPLRNVWSV